MLLTWHMKEVHLEKKLSELKISFIFENLIEKKIFFLISSLLAYEKYSFKLVEMKIFLTKKYL